MGVKLKDIIRPEQIDFKDLKGRAISIDAFNTLYQFLSTIRQRDGRPLSDSNGNTIFAYTPVKDADSVILSSADLTEGETYTFIYGEQSESITVDSVNTTNDTRSSMEPGKR